MIERPNIVYKFLKEHYRKTLVLRISTVACAKKLRVLFMASISEILKFEVFWHRRVQPGIRPIRHCCAGSPYSVAMVSISSCEI